MAAMLAVLLFVVAVVFGCALLRAVSRELDPALLLQAPILGFAAVMIVSTTLNRAGIPVRLFAWIEIFAGAIASAMVLVGLRPRVQLMPLLPFAVILGAAFILIGHPIFEFGFNWISFGNPDMVNYCLEAERFVRSGWDQIPSIAAVADMKDSPAVYWMFNVLFGERYATSELLAVIISTTGHPGFEIFMPTLLALTMSLIASASGLVYRSARHRGAAILTGALLAIDAEFALGTLSQLLDQVAGLALLCATIVAWLRLAGEASVFLIVPSVALSGLAYAYPECIPFAMVSCSLMWIRRYARSWLTMSISRSQRYLTALITALALTNAYLVTDFVVFRLRVRATIETALFPYYLLPTGFANLAGVIPQGTFPSARSADLVIAVGVAFVALALMCIVYGLIQDEPASYVAAIMVPMMVIFFVHRASFSLFKMAMFIQPFAAACIALAVIHTLSSNGARRRAATIAT